LIIAENKQNRNTSSRAENVENRLVALRTSVTGINHS